MIDLTNAPKDATHYCNLSDGSIVFYKILTPEFREIEAFGDDEWVNDLSGLEWLIDNLTRIEWHVKLVNGKAYQFELKDSGALESEPFIGIYNVDRDTINTIWDSFSVGDCINIIELVPEGVSSSDMYRALSELDVMINKTSWNVFNARDLIDAIKNHIDTDSILSKARGE